MYLTKKLAAVAAVTMMSTGIAHAGYITTFTSGMTTQVAGATVYDFEGGKPSGYGGDGDVLSTSIDGKAAAPAGDTTKYLSVAYPNPAGKETFIAAAGQSYDYFGLYWGSIDDYNLMKFFSGDTLLATINGLNVIQAGTQLGDQVAAGANRYVNFFFSDVTFDRIEFCTTQYAFESDNHAFARTRPTSVPEPGSLALMAVALLAAGVVTRRRRQMTLQVRSR